MTTWTYESFLECILVLFIPQYSGWQPLSKRDVEELAAHSKGSPGTPPRTLTILGSGTMKTRWRQAWQIKERKSPLLEVL